MLVLWDIFRFEALSPPQFLPNIAPLYPNFALLLLVLVLVIGGAPGMFIYHVGASLPLHELRCESLHVLSWEAAASSCVFAQNEKE